RFRTKVFLAALAAAAAALSIATVIIAWELRAEERAFIERRLTDQAVLIAELLSRSPAMASEAALDDEADRLAVSIDGRITLIAQDGRVVGDSTADGSELAALDNHLQRPEVSRAREQRIGIVERY